jgi:hypothetical protein
VYVEKLDNKKCSYSQMGDRVFVKQISIALRGDQQDRMIGDARPCRMMACSSGCKSVRWSRREPFTRQILLWKQQQVGLWLIGSFIYNRLVKGGQHLKHDRPNSNVCIQCLGGGVLPHEQGVSARSHGVSCDGGPHPITRLAWTSM